MAGSAVLLGLLGFWAGFFAVPVNALIQHRPSASDKGGIIAAANLLSFVGIAISSGVYFVFTSYIHLDPRGVIVAASLITAAGTVYVLVLLPEWFARLILFFITRSLYRIQVVGRDNFSEKSGALLVCNHMSFVDAALLVAATDRPIRFIMYQGIYDHPLVKPFAAVMKAIPISSEQHPREMIRSLHAAGEALRQDEIVCIFAEGQITRTGQLLPFRRGLERIMKDVDAPIIPVNLDGVWGSIFSFERGRFLWKLPRRMAHKITVSFGKPMPPASTAIEVRAAVQELHAEAFARRKPFMNTLDRAFVSTARRFRRRFMMADGNTPRLTFGAALTRTMYIAGRLRRLIGDRRMIGVLLPPSVGGALTNYALMLLGRVPVNLNYTSSNEVIASCAAQCGLDVVITSKAFLERLPNLTIPGRTLLLEDALREPAFTERLRALALAWFVPAAWLRRALSGRTRSPVLGPGKERCHARQRIADGPVGDRHLLQRQHRRSQGRDAQPLQSRIEHQPGEPGVHAGRARQDHGHPAVLSFLRFHGRPVAAGRQRRGRRVSSQSARRPGHRRSHCPVQGHLHGRHAHLPPDLHSPLLAGELQLARVRAGGRGEAARSGSRWHSRTGSASARWKATAAPNARRWWPSTGATIAPRASCRSPPGAAGSAIRSRASRVKVVDIETGAPVPPGTAGMLLVKGPNVMRGYLGNARQNR